jgi:hypothetical protein
MYCFFFFTFMEAIMFIYFLYETGKIIIRKRKGDSTTNGIEMLSTVRHLHETLDVNDHSTESPENVKNMTVYSSELVKNAHIHSSEDA